MKASDYISLAALPAEEIYRDDPTVLATGEIVEPYRYMTYNDLVSADPETVRGYVDYIRRVYHVTNAQLARTLGVTRQTLIYHLTLAGVPHMARADGHKMCKVFSRVDWDRFVHAGLLRAEPEAPETANEQIVNEEKQTPAQPLAPGMTIDLSGVTPPQVIALLHSLPTFTRLAVHIEGV